MKNKIYSFIQKMLCLGHLPALVSKTANRLHLLCTSTQLSTNPLPWMTLTSVCSCHTVIFLNVWPTFFHRQSLNFLHSLKTPTKLLVYSILPDTFRVIPTPSPFFFLLDVCFSYTTMPHCVGLNVLQVFLKKMVCSAVSKSTQSLYFEVTSVTFSVAQK